MIETMNTLKTKYSNYGNIYTKIKREVNNGVLFQIKRGIYSTSLNENSFAIANTLIAPSYISFETALAYYGMIPERVVLVMSATSGLNKIKMFKNNYGSFYYQDVYENVFNEGVDYVEVESGNKIYIASKEKALLDTISKISPRKSVKEVRELLFDDLRIDEIEFDNLNKDRLVELSKLYRGHTFIYLRKMLGYKND